MILPPNAPISPFMDTFGYHSSEELQKKGLNSGANYANLLGYIPIIGTIIGIARIYICLEHFVKKECKKHDHNTMLGFWQITRGVIELTSCGLILAIPDLLFTVGRLMMQNRNCLFEGRNKVYCVKVS